MLTFRTFSVFIYLVWCYDGRIHALVIVYPVIHVYVLPSCSWDISLWTKSPCRWSKLAQWKLPFFNVFNISQYLDKSATFFGWSVPALGTIVSCDCFSHHGGSFPDQFDDVASVRDWHLRCIQDVNAGVQDAALILQGGNTLTLTSFFVICSDVCVCSRVFVCTCPYAQ